MLCCLIIFFVLYRVLDFLFLIELKDAASCIRGGNGAISSVLLEADRAVAQNGVALRYDGDLIRIRAALQQVIQFSLVLDQVFFVAKVHV